MQMQHDGHAKVYDDKTRDGEDFQQYMDAVLDQTPGKIPKAKLREHYAFVDRVIRRRMSKEGRFLRLHFKGGATRVVVPGNSIASGAELVLIGGQRTSQRFKSPDIDHLARKFRRPRKPK